LHLQLHVQKLDTATTDHRQVVDTRAVDTQVVVDSHRLVLAASAHQDSVEVQDLEEEASVVDQASVDHQHRASEDHQEDSEDTQVDNKLPLFRNTSTFMFHLQSKKKSELNDQFQLLQLKNITKSSSLRPQVLHNIKHQSSHNNLKTKKRLSSTFWSRNLMNNKTSSSQLQHQLSQANQKFTSLSTRHKKSQAVLVVTMLELVVISVALLVASVALLVVSVHQLVDSMQHLKILKASMDLLENKKLLIPIACLVFLL
jgi:hypothetical protein